MLLLLIAANQPGFVEVDGGVAQEAYVSESPGWRCDPDNPLKVTIEGKALMYVQVLANKLPKQPRLELMNGAREIILDGVPGFTKAPKGTKGYRVQTDFALQVPEGPQPYAFICPRGSLVKMVSVDKIAKKVATVR